MEKNLNLSDKEFDKLVKDLQNGDEKLFEIAFRKLVSQTISYLKRKYRFEDFDLKDAAVNALYKLRNNMINDSVKPQNIRFLYSKMVYQEYQKIKSTTNKVLPLKESIYISKHNPEQNKYTEEHFKLLDQAFEKLEPYCVELLKRLYISKEKLIEIAKKMNIEYNTLRKRKQRCLDNLKLILKPMVYNKLNSE